MRYYFALYSGAIIIESNIHVAIAKAQARNSLPKIFGTLCAKGCGLRDAARDYNDDEIQGWRFVVGMQKYLVIND